jgi:alginate O-acetyltransferase complex protein AlgJ
MKTGIPFCISASYLICTASLADGASPSASPATAQFAAFAAKAEADQRAAVAGKDGWLFLTAELRHLGVGRFWGDAAMAASRSTRQDAADPLPAILDFQAQLKQAGIELVFMPVPAKAAIYPDKLLDAPAPKQGDRGLTGADDEFLKLCAGHGVSVLDLAPAFRAARTDETVPVYCLTDSHWSGRGCEVAAELLSKAIRARPWFAGVSVRKFKSERRDRKITGDLTEIVGGNVPAETLRLRVVTDDSGAPPSDWRESPVLLMGDSHTLVFHAGEDMHGTGAGLADQLAFELGFPVDVVGVRGSGATPARINLMRRQDNLAGKKLVIWCFSVREFTEAPGGWRLVPVIGSMKK